MCILDYTPYKLLDWIPVDKLDPENYRITYELYTYLRDTKMN